MRGQVIQGFFIGGAIRPQPAPRAAIAEAPPRHPTGARAPAFAGRSAPLQARMAPGRPPLAHQGAGHVAQPRGGDGSFEIDPVQIGLARGGGQPLPQVLLAKMEAAFGADFSAVRVHVGPQASRIGAIAFTTGDDLYFAPGRYRPDSVQGRQLIGHELAHVIQQRQGRVRTPGSGVAVVQDPALEAEADRLAMRAVAPGAVQAKMGRPPVLRKAAAPGFPPPVFVGRGSPSRIAQRAQSAVGRPPIQRSVAAVAVLHTHIVSRSQTPEIYWFTCAAIEQGAPTTLTYVENKTSTVYARNSRQLIIPRSSLAKDEEASEVTIRDVAREKVFGLGTQLAGARKSWENGYSRDEYPYASTLECGTDAYWAYVPVKEQCIQGGLLSGLYKKLNDGDKF
ncbi:MAG TPA: DUF4157 domain-containing protein, partial [Allosphingosinicella sp.]